MDLANLARPDGNIGFDEQVLDWVAYRSLQTRWRVDLKESDSWQRDDDQPPKKLRPWTDNELRLFHELCSQRIDFSDHHPVLMADILIILVRDQANENRGVAVSCVCVPNSLPANGCRR